MVAAKHLLTAKHNDKHQDMFKHVMNQKAAIERRANIREYSISVWLQLDTKTACFIRMLETFEYYNALCILKCWSWSEYKFWAAFDAGRFYFGDVRRFGKYVIRIDFITFYMLLHIWIVLKLGKIELWLFSSYLGQKLISFSFYGNNTFSITYLTTHGLHITLTISPHPSTNARGHA